MNSRIFIILALCIVSIKLSAQTEYLTESQKDIYWQPNVRIDFSDYRSPSDTDCGKYSEKYGLKTDSSIGIRGIVDIPTKKGKEKIEKFYLAAVFCKNCSCVLSEDSLSLKVDQLLFDMAEVCARNARKDLLALQEEMNADNTYSMFFTTVKNRWDENMKSIMVGVIGDILIEKKDGSYVVWRQRADEGLQQTESYATQPEDCYRFVLGKPIEKGYKKAKTIMGDMRQKDEEK